MKIARLLLAIIICEGAGILGTFFTINSVNTWYATLEKPAFNPPSWVFGPVWTVLYLLMGISLYFAWEKRISLKWFWIQLVLNSLWSIIFFGLQNPLLAFIEIILLTIAIIMTIKTFWNKDKRAALFLYPYLLWVVFAGFLNFYIVFYNWNL